MCNQKYATLEEKRDWEISFRSTRHLITLRNNLRINWLWFASPPDRSSDSQLIFNIRDTFARIRTIAPEQNPPVINREIHNRASNIITSPAIFLFAESIISNERRIEYTRRDFFIARKSRDFESRPKNTPWKKQRDKIRSGGHTVLHVWVTLTPTSSTRESFLVRSVARVAVRVGNKWGKKVEKKGAASEQCRSPTWEVKLVRRRSRCCRSAGRSPRYLVIV